MAYDKNTWVDQQVQRPKTYQVTNNDDGSITLIDHFGNVTELGTPVNADHMNYIENGIANTTRKYSITETFNNGEIVQGTVDGETDFYKSKVAENLGNALTDTNSWEKASFGGRGGSGFNLFDLVLKDHVLSYEESEGFALQGTYVYKEPVAGSRYGYPDFYAKCLEEYNNSVGDKINATIHGSPTVSSGVVTNFSTENYILPQRIYGSTTISWECMIKFKTPVTFSENAEALYRSHTFFNIQLNNGALEFTNDSGNSPLTYITGATLIADTEYHVKVTWNGSQYEMFYSTDAEAFTSCGTYSSTTLMRPTNNVTIGLGGAALDSPFTGSIDLNGCYINLDNKRAWNGILTRQNPNGHIFYDIADKDVVDELYEQRGEAWFYGVDTENERVFLPRAKRFEFGSNEEVGEYQEAGLPNITGDMTNFAGASYVSNQNGVSSQGAFNVLYTGASNFRSYSSGGQFDLNTISLDASNSNPIYGNSDTVTPSATKQLLYIVVGNTTQQSGVTDVVDITTTENDTVPLFTPQYFDFEPNHPSWLKAGTQANYGDIYTTAYNELVNALTNNPQNILVVDSSEMESDTDYSEYWIVHQDTMTFRTPLRLPASPLANNAGCKGNGIAIGATNGTANAGLTVGGANPYTSLMAQYYLGAYGEVVGTDVSTAAAFTNGEAIGLTTDTEKSGIIVDTSNQPLNLYFKVANAVQNLELLDVGEVMETLADKVDMTNTQWATNACMPDYCAGISVIGYTGTSNQFTAPCDGMIIFSGTLGGQAYLNNTLYADYQSGTASAGNNFNIFISKNDTFYYNSTVKGDGLAMKFYPLKGANQ